MSEEVSAESGAAAGHVGDKAKDESIKDQTVRFQDHKRVLDDALKFKSKLKETESTISDLQAKLQSYEESEKLREGKKDELLDGYKKQIEEHKQRETKFVQSFYENKKRDALLLAAQKAGLRKEAESDLDLISYDDVEVEKTDQGRVLVHGIDSKIESLQKQKPHWFKTSDPPRINSGGGSVPPRDPEKLTVQDMLVLEKKDPAKYREIYPKFAEAQRKRRLGLVS